ncbi:MAG: universal stress protein [Devosia sp.]|nr:universal stress protein [Devosia sp.]
MSYKSILVHVEPNPASDARIAVAIELARRFGGRVIGIGAQSFYPLVGFGYDYVDPGTIQTLQGILEENLGQAETRFRNATQDLSAVWRSAFDTPNRVIAEQARGADLVIASQAPPHCDETAFARPGDLIMTTGLPVLLLPPDHSDFSGRRILIGWKNTLQARSALSAALPLLKVAEKVVLARVQGNDEDDARSELQDVADRLTLHGVKPVCEVLERTESSVALDLLKAAKERDLDVVVVGAYAHARVSEWAFGGVTQDLLRLADRPVLFAR